ncbi:LOW QUALITY PROTEIN: hypothetical protein ACHAXR_007432 [Thalassiosira sp. AJA248-18]
MVRTIPIGSRAIHNSGGPPAGKKPPPPMPAAAVPPLPALTLEQRQLAEFNQWLFRWNNYQQHLSHYWQGRYHALYQQAAPGGGKIQDFAKKEKGKKSSKGVDRVEMKWNMRYQELIDFMEEHGHVNVPKEFTYKYSPPLGHWVGRMRYLHKAGKLDPERLRRLQEIGFEFVISKTKDIKFSVVWDKSFQALKAFKDMNGHVEVPNGYKPQPDMAELDGWITRQRKHFRDGKLPDHLKSKIQELGINLGGRGRPFGIESEEMWSRNYKALAEYCSENGDCDIPEKYDDDRELGKWVKTQRDAYSDGMLPEDRVTMLNQIGFNFYHGRKSAWTKKSDPWERRISELKAYKEKAGNTNVPRKFTLNFGLGDFVYNQRMAYLDKKLSDEKIKSLEDLRFDWTVKPKKKGKKQPTNWDKRFEELVEYKEKHGNLNIPNGYEPNPTLVSWSKRQRKYQREGAMKSEKYERLKTLGFDFGGPKQEKKPWETHYQALVEFRKENGHNDVPVVYEPNPQLYYWIGTQKQSFKKGKLSDGRVALLQEIDFDFTVKAPRMKKRKGTRGGNKPFLDPEEFEKLVGQLIEYKEKHGDVDVPQRSGRLGSFVHYMRFYIKGGKLSQDIIDRLTEIGFSWNVTMDRWNAKYEGENIVGIYLHFPMHSMLTIVISVFSFGQVQGRTWQLRRPIWAFLVSTPCQLTMNSPCLQLLGFISKEIDDSLPEDRVEMLSNIDFDFDIPEPKKRFANKESPESWPLRFQDLEEFKDEHGHCRVPTTYAPNPSLAKWAATQRTKYKKGSLKDDHLGKPSINDCQILVSDISHLCSSPLTLFLESLNEIGFNFGAKDPIQELGVLKVPQIEPVNRETYLEDLWDASYTELAAYKNHFGHCNIPISYDANPSLGAWAFSQRMAYKKNKLSEDRIAKLNELGFSFGPQKKVAEV